MRWRLVIALLCAAVSFGFNSNPAGSGGAVAGGNCTGGMFMTGITTAGVPVCGTPSGGAPYPPGSPPQITGYSALNTGESDTVVGDFTFARSGANQYTATVTKTNGVNFSGLATAAIPLSIANGGLGGSTAPTANQILVASSPTVFAPVTMSGDATISGGAITVTKLNGVAPGPLYAATTPLSIANGGRGSSTAPTAGMIDVAQSATAFGAVAMSGDATITSTGAITVSRVNGVSGPFLTGAAASITDTMLANPYSGVGACGTGTFASTLNRNAAPTCTSAFTAAGDLTGSSTSQTVVGIRSTSVPALASGYLHYTGTAFVWDSPATGSYAPATNPAGGASNYAAIASPTFTGTITTAGGSWSATTLTAPTINATTAFQLNGVAFGGSCSAGSFVNAISAGVIPTCGANLATVYAPLTNPAGGSGNYLPISNPTATGVMTTPQLVMSNTTGTQIFFNNSSTSPGGALIGVGANNMNMAAGAHYVAGTGWTADATNPTVVALGGGGIQLEADTGKTVGTGYVPTVMLAATSTGILLPAPGPATQLYIGNTTAAPYASLSADTAHDLNMGGGVHENGTAWIADATAGAIVQASPSGVYFFHNTGLTVGNTYSPALIATVTTAGVNVAASGHLMYNGTSVGGFTYQYSGSGSGASYTTTSTAYTPVDSGRLSPAFTAGQIPVGSIVTVSLSGSMVNSVNTQPACIALVDASANILHQQYISGSTWNGVGFTWSMAGDGAAHTFQTEYASCGGSGTTSIANGGIGDRMKMVISMRPDGAFAQN